MKKRNIGNNLKIFLINSFVKDRQGKLYEEEPIRPDIDSDMPIEDGKFGLKKFCNKK